MSLLTLVPTPIDEDSMLCPKATELLLQACTQNHLIVVEEHKIARRRWLKYGLPREAIDKFIIYNEHTHNEVAQDLIKKLKNGKQVFMMSDCGLPAFCDPGRKLVELCHQNKIQVTSTPFANSVVLAVALSGFEHDRFVFEGFIPNKGGDRAKAIQRIAKAKEMSVIMDTPYRLDKLVKEFSEYAPMREAFLGMQLNMKSEVLERGPLTKLAAIEKGKKEFILILRRLN